MPSDHSWHQQRLPSCRGQRASWSQWPSALVRYAHRLLKVMGVTSPRCSSCRPARRPCGGPGSGSGPLATDLVAGGHTVPCLSPGASFLQGLQRWGPLIMGLSLYREGSPTPLLLFPWKVAFCFICLINTTLSEGHSSYTEDSFILKIMGVDYNV